MVCAPLNLGPDAARAEGQGSGASSGAGRDWTQVPRELDEKFESLDKDQENKPIKDHPHPNKNGSCGMKGRVRMP